jgi:hypothetical protein
MVKITIIGKVAKMLQAKDGSHIGAIGLLLEKQS